MAKSAVKQSEPVVETVEPARPAALELHWFECFAGALPKHDIQAPNEDAARMLYMQRMRITGPMPTAKRVA